MIGHPGEEPFPLRRALEKLTSLPRHIASLYGFAHSPRLMPALRYGLSISAVPNEPHAVQLPTSLKDWESFLVATCGGSYDFQKEHAVGLAQMFKSGRCMCPVHCKCRLIQYLQTRGGNQWDQVSPFNYIGVSKLSCGACRVWMEAFNERSGRKFYTRGSHGKWYWPWGVPGRVGGVANAMAQRVLDEYHMYLKNQKLRRSYSESTGVSSEGAEHHLSDHLKNNAMAAAAAKMNAHGGFGPGYFAAKYPVA